jgi:hypothetical protein
MKRTDAIFATALMLLASFVGVQAIRARAPYVRPEISTTSFGSSVDREEDVPSSRLVARITFAPRNDSAGAHSVDVVADSRRRLQQYASGTYINDVLIAHDSAVARWQDRRGVPLHVWVQEAPPIADWNPDNVALVREAFIAWSEAGVPINFTFVLDSASAEVHVTWIERFSEPISGKTLWTHDSRWWIVGADILLALHHHAGEPLDASAIRAISLHEVGHLIGLDHTTDTTSIMSPRVHTRDLAPADRATVQLIYSLPPGSIRREPRLPAQRER